jgi:glucosyl-3-phosphoglycerate phosphatase
MHVRDLHNTYVILRHGHSETNAAGIILSDPKQGVGAYGLSAQGRQQVETSVRAALQRGLLPTDTIIISSDFLRCRDTAEIARTLIKTEKVILDIRLRERYFGDYEGTSNKNYDEIWKRDVTDPYQPTQNVESVHSVLQRVCALMVELESTYTHRTILLVSHGDTLQILQTEFQQLEPQTHRSLPHLQTGEVRRMNST